MGGAPEKQIKEALKQRTSDRPRQFFIKVCGAIDKEYSSLYLLRPKHLDRQIPSFQIFVSSDSFLFAAFLRGFGLGQLIAHVQQQLDRFRLHAAVQRGRDPTGFVHVVRRKNAGLAAQGCNQNRIALEIDDVELLRSCKSQLVRAALPSSAQTISGCPRDGTRRRAACLPTDNPVV